MGHYGPAGIDHRPRENSNLFHSVYLARGAGNGGLNDPIRILPSSVTFAGSMRRGGSAVPLSSITGVGTFTVLTSFTVLSNI